MESSRDDRESVFILHNQISPYRLPIFEALTTWYDVSVYFARTRSPDREWQASLKSNTFEYDIGSFVEIGEVLINYDLVRKLRSRSYDVYIIASITESTVFSVLLTWFTAKLRRKPLIFWSEFVETDYHAENYPLKRRIGDIYRRRIAKDADRCIAFSKMNEQHLLNLGVDEEKIIRTAQIMPVEQMANVDDVDESGIKNTERTTVLSLCYLRQNKGISELVRAFKKLNPDDAELIIAGDGPQMQHLQELASGIENIRFTGYIEEPKKARIYDASDVFVLPTKWDSWGLVVNEAMYHGLPVITTESAGSKELIDGNGFVVEPGDVSALEEALDRLLADAELRIEMGERSKEIIKQYDTELLVSAFRQAIDGITEPSVVRSEI